MKGNFFKKLSAIALGVAMAIGIGVAVGSNSNAVQPAHAAGKITNYTKITGGSYYIGATTGNNDYYLSVDGSKTNESLAGTAVDSKTNATIFVFSSISTTDNTWSIKFSNSDYYLGLKNSKDNGKVQVVENPVAFTASTVSQKLRLTIGNYSIQKNNSGTQFGSYGNTQTDIWIEAAEKYTVSFAANNNDYSGDLPESLTEASVGSGVTLPAALECNGYDWLGWNTSEGGGQSTRKAAGSLFKPSGNCTLYGEWNLKTYTVTGNITNGSLSSTSSITHGGNLELTIIPTSSDYEKPENVTVTMGGSSIDALYDPDDGSVYYTPVTGNIVITATCQKIPTYTIDYSNITNGSASGATSIHQTIGANTIISLTANEHYVLPQTISVTSGGVSLTADDDYIYDGVGSNNGSVLIGITANYTGNIVISFECQALRYNPISVTYSNVMPDANNPTGVYDGDDVVLSFTPATDYALPDEVTVSGTEDYLWDKSKGVLTITGHNSDITVSISGDPKALLSIAISSNSGSYTLGDDFNMPTVTATFNTGVENVTNDAVVTGYNPYATGNQTIKISYEYEGVKLEKNYTATVSAESIIITTTWNLVTSASSLSAGDVVIIAGKCGGNYQTKAMSTTQNDSNRGETTISVNNSKATISDSVQQFTLVAGTKTNSFGFYTGSGYIYAASSSSNNLRTKDTLDDNGSFTVSISSNAATLTAQGTNTRNKVKYNSGSSLFSCYSSGQQDISLYKKTTTQTGTKSLIRITAEYTGGTKYVDDPISVSDFVVKAQYNTGVELVTLDSGVSITSGSTLPSTSNIVTLSYTEDNVTKTVDVVVEATERDAQLQSVTLIQGENVKKSGYIDYDAATWNLTDLSVKCDWDDDTFDETFTLQELVDSGDATITPTKPTVGATSFTVTYSYHQMAISDGTVTLTTAVISDYVSSMTWNGTSADQFKAYVGDQLTEETVNSWNIVPTMAGAGVQDKLSFGDYTLKVGTKTIESLPYTWAAEDDGQELSITYGKKADGSDFVKKNGTAKCNICPLLNVIDHEEATSGEHTLSNFLIDMTITDAGKSGGGEDASATSHGFTLSSTNGYIYETQIRSYKNSTFTISSSYTIKNITFTFNGSNTGGLETSYTNINASSKTFADLGSQARIDAIEIVFEGDYTETVHYANQMNHFDAQKAVVKYAKAFNAAMSAENVCDGTFANLSTGWGNAKTAYQTFLSDISGFSSGEQDYAKNMIKYATAQWSDNSDAACVERMMKTYEYCLSHYKNLNLEAFMSDIKTAPSNYSVYSIVNVSHNTAAPMILIVVGVITLTAVGGYYYLKHQKGKKEKDI